MDHGDGIALTFARTETRAFFNCVWPHADAILFLKGRLRFYKPDGTQGQSAGSPSCLIAYGKHNAEILKDCGLEGVFIPLQDSNLIR